MMVVPVCILFAYATSAFAHAVVFPKRADPGAYEKYVIRVPNERDQPTTRVEIHFPASVRVVSFADVPGWTLQLQLDSAQRIIGAAWTGRLAPQRFVEFPLVAVNPKTATQIVWPVIQTYGDGQVVEWSGPEGSEKPASVTTIGALAAAGAPGGAPWSDNTAAATTTTPTGEVKDAMFSAPTLTAIAALVLAVIAIGLALRKAVRDH
jgi:uncharacterized protein YcnI